MIYRSMNWNNASAGMRRCWSRWRRKSSGACRHWVIAATAPIHSPRWMNPPRNCCAKRRDSLRRGGRFRAEREHLLVDETVGHVVADDTVVGREGFFLRHFHRRAEHVIEEGVVRRVVAVDRLVVLRVMPVMEIRRHDQILQRSPQQKHKNKKKAYII